MSSLAQGAFGVIQGLYILSLGWSETVLGTVLSFRMLAAAVASVPAGIISDRMGRKPVLVAGGVLTTVGYLGMAIVSAPLPMIAFSCIVGIAQACQATSGAPLLAESSTGEDRSRLFGVNFSLSMLVNMIGSLLGGVLPEQMKTIGMIPAYRISLAVFSFVTLVGVMPAARMIEQVRGSTHTSAVEELRGLANTAAQRAVLNLLVYSTFIGIGAGLVTPYFNVFLSNKLGVDSAVVGLILSFSQGATGIAGLIAPILANRFGKVATVVGTQLASIPFLLLVALPPNVYVVAFALFMRSALMNMSNPVASTFSMEVVDADRRGKVSSLMRIADNLTRAVSAAIAGWIMANWNYEIPYFFTAVLYLMASVVYYRAFKGWENRVPARETTSA